MPLPTSSDHTYQWSQAKSLMPVKAQCERGLQGALIPDSRGEKDHIAVVYDKGYTPPTITIKQVSGTVILFSPTGSQLQWSHVPLVRRLLPRISFWWNAALTPNLLPE